MPFTKICIDKANYEFILCTPNTEQESTCLMRADNEKEREKPK